jgi:hypothetical protein
MPKGLPKRWQSHYQKLAERAPDRYRDAVYLKCVDCVAWDRVEATHCHIATCALWIHNRRIFKKQK